MSICLALPPASLAAQAAGERQVWRGLMGDVAIDIRATQNTVRLGVAGDTMAVTVQLRSSDVRRYLDSLDARLLPRRLRDSTWTLRVEEPGVGAGVLSISPVRGAKGAAPRRYALFAADEVIGGVRQVLSANELRLLSRHLRRAAAPAKPAPKAKRPAAKRPATARPNAKRKPSG